MNEDDQQIHQSLVGAPQWVIQIGRFDITASFMTLSRFRVMPRQGHLDCVKRSNWCLSKMRHATTKIRTDAPDHLAIPIKMCDGEHTCCDDPSEETPPGAPAPKGKPATVTSFFDANLRHDVISGKSVTRILHLSNQTPTDLVLQASVCCRDCHFWIGAHCCKNVH